MLVDEFNVVNAPLLATNVVPMLPIVPAYTLFPIITLPCSVPALPNMFPVMVMFLVLESMVASVKPVAL